MRSAWFHKSNVVNSLWIAEFFVGERALSVMDDFGNLVPVLHYKTGFMHFFDQGSEGVH